MSDRVPKPADHGKVAGQRPRDEGQEKAEMSERMSKAVRGRAGAGRGQREREKMHLAGGAGASV